MPNNGMQTAVNEDFVLTGMVTNTDILAAIAPKWNGDQPFSNQGSNLIAQWCVKYFNKYGKAPKSNIEGLYAEWAERKTRDKGLVAYVEKKLNYLSEKHETNGHDASYTTDKALEILNLARAAKVAEELSDATYKHDFQRVKEIINSYEEIDSEATDYEDLFEEQKMTDQLFVPERYENLIEYPGAAGKFFSNCWHRKGFIAIIAPDKSGKSFWLLDVAFRAALQRRRAAFFDAGDNDLGYIMQRIATRATKRPWEAGKLMFPIDIGPAVVDKHGNVTAIPVKCKNKSYDKDLTRKEVEAAFKRIKDKIIRSKSTYLKVRSYHNDTLTTTEIRSRILRWQRKGWQPDVVVLDYADILADPPYARDTRHATDKNWKALRSIAAEFNCLVVTATQAKATAYNMKQGGTMGKEHFSEDKRKNAHPTGVIGIVQTDQDKELQITRLNWAARRNARFNRRKQLFCAGCLEISNPAVRTTMQVVREK